MKLLLLTTVMLLSAALAPAQTRRETIAVQQPQIHIQARNVHTGSRVRVGGLARSITLLMRNVRVNGPFGVSLSRLLTQPVRTDQPTVRK